MDWPRHGENAQRCYKLDVLSPPAKAWAQRMTETKTAEPASAVYFTFADTYLDQAVTQVLGTEVSKPVSVLKELAAK